MSFILRSLTAGRSVVSCPVAAPALYAAAPSLLTSLRFSSTSSSSTTPRTPSTNQPTPTSNPFATSRALQNLEGINLSKAPTVPTDERDPDAFWNPKGVMREQKNNGFPGDPHSGRGVFVPDPNSFMTRYRLLMRILATTNVRTEQYRAQAYEKPSQTKFRLKNERNKRRFQEEVGRNVKQALTVADPQACSSRADVAFAQVECRVVVMCMDKSNFCALKRRGKSCWTSASDGAPQVLTVSGSLNKLSDSETSCGRR